MRLRQRYLIAQLLGQDADPGDVSALTPQDLLIAVRESAQTLFGDVGTGVHCANLSIKLFDKDSRRKLFVLRVNRGSFRQIWLALSCIQAIKRFSCSIRVLQVAGCHRTCKEKTLRVTRKCFIGEEEVSGKELESCSRRIEEAFKDP